MIHYFNILGQSILAAIALALFMIVWISWIGFLTDTNNPIRGKLPIIIVFSSLTGLSVFLINL